MTTDTSTSKAMSLTATADIAALRPDLERLVEQAIDAVSGCTAKPDATFGVWAEIVAAIRSTAFHEGKLLERGIARLAACNPDLSVVPLERPMPVVPAAREVLRRNEGVLRGLRLSPEVHSRETYAPDLVIVDRKRHAALILDVKRSLLSYEMPRLNELRSKMLAVAMIASDWLTLECRTPPIVDVSVAIVDGSDEMIDHERGIWGLSEIDVLLEIEGAGAAMGVLRDLFGKRVRALLAERCRKEVQQSFIDAASASLSGLEAVMEPGASALLGSSNSGGGLIDSVDDVLALGRAQAGAARVGFARGRVMQ
ncbi:hypothetical protein [Aquamicrobium zhengzhouense]|uniref:Uncharacterized protein n=1 Tax=Aquamicrobium zhengzhouense TaxID=2781738 RepID=A0ABS0SC16_9HYPH|nr:hypothetical protein [Aquamicrobium zhengzhouense]MBI1620812.1 hypothetical protein [Aquamicrobium zhengzhouense]